MINTMNLYAMKRPMRLVAVGPLGQCEPTNFDKGEHAMPFKQLDGTNRWQCMTGAGVIEVDEADLELT